MVRSAAKNFQDVAIVTSPADYDAIARRWRAAAESLSLTTKWRLAQKAFATTAAYDSAIASTLEQIGAPRRRRRNSSSAATVSRNAAAQLSQGVRLALWRESASEGGAVLRRLGQGHCERQAASGQGAQLQQHCRSAGGMGPGAGVRGDRSAPSSSTPILAERRSPATLAEAYKRALECDPVSAFGGVIGVNRPIDRDTATEMAKLFVEAIAAPGFDAAAREIFATKKNLRLVEVVPMEQKWVLKNVSGGVLLQDNDVHPLTEADLKVVSERKPTEQEMRDLLFAWKVCKHVKSNAILYARNGQTHGRWRRSDEPRGFGENRRDEVGAGNQRLGRRVRCILPFPRRSRGDRQGRSDGHHSARRLGARSGSDRYREQAGAGDGANRRAALPALRRKLSAVSHRHSARSGLSESSRSLPFSSTSHRSGGVPDHNQATGVASS